MEHRAFHSDPRRDRTAHSGCARGVVFRRRQKRNRPDDRARPARLYQHAHGITTRSRESNGKCQTFAPIGRTGLWSLRDCPNVQTGTVPDIAAQILSTPAMPLTEPQLFELIQPLRAVRRGSIGTLLREENLFRRVAPAVWTLCQQEPSPV